MILLGLKIQLKETRNLSKTQPLGLYIFWNTRRKWVNVLIKRSIFRKFAADLHSTNASYATVR